MPKPFLYDATFINAPATDPVTGTDLIQNIQSMRSMLWEIGRQYSITITPYATAGIIAGAILASGGNPAREQAGFVNDIQQFYNCYGLFQRIYATTPPNDGVADMDQLGYDIYHNLYYDQNDSGVSLTDYLSSGDNDYLGLLWLRNYTFGRFFKPAHFFDYQPYEEYAQDVYDYVLYYVQNTSLPISKKALAIFVKKRKRRWWR